MCDQRDAAVPTGAVPEGHHGLCPKTDCPDLVEDTGPQAIQDIGYKIIGNRLMVICHCDENVGVCYRKATMRETARARALGKIK